MTTWVNLASLMVVDLGLMPPPMSLPLGTKVLPAEALVPPDTRGFMEVNWIGLRREEPGVLGAEFGHAEEKELAPIPWMPCGDEAM